MEQRVYLDHAAASPLLPEAAAAMSAAWALPGNPSSLHGSGRAVRRVLEEARESLAGMLGAHPTEVVFTSGGTEANNLALIGGLDGHRTLDPGRRRLAISSIEHPSVAAVARRLPDSVDVLPVASDGRLELAGLGSITNGTALVSVMLVNNETGAIQPVAEVVDAARAAGAWTHTDAVQAFGQMPLSFAELEVDALTVTAHKIGGPVGIGALLVRRDRPLAAWGFGGGQERKLRSGTAQAALASGFAAAARIVADDLRSTPARLDQLRQRLLAGALAIEGTSVNGEHVSPHITNLTFARCRADDLLLVLDAAGIDASTGSACTAGVHQPSEVLLAMGRPLADASGSLRFSLGRTTTPADIDRLLAVLPEAVARARVAFA